MTAWWRNHWPALVMLIVLGFVAAVRMHLLSAPMERDEGEYAYAGRLMLEGVPPYKLSYNMKMPGTYAAYAASMALFGQTAGGMRTGLLLANAATIALVCFLGRRLLTPAGALAASATYALLSVSPGVLGPYMHATHFVVLPALAGTLVLLRAQETGRLGGFFGSGCLYGTAFLMKQPGGLFALLGIALLAWDAAHRQPADWKAHARRLGAFSAGVAAPIALVLVALWRFGVWDRFWWWTVTYAGVHATAAPWSQGKVALADRLVSMGWDLAFWAMAEAGLALLLIERGRARDKFLMVSLLLVSAASVCPTFNFTSHYFVLMLPAVALLCAVAFDVPARRLASLRASPLLRSMPWVIFCLLWAFVAWTHRAVFFELSPAEATAEMYPVNDFQIYPEVGAYLDGHTPPDATLAVLGSEPELLFYARRRSVTGYIYMYDLVQEQPFREKMEREMMDEIERGKPDFLVVVNLKLSWLADSRAKVGTLRRWMRDCTEGHYEPFGAVAAGPNHRCFWGPDSFQRAPNRFLSIYERKPSSAPLATEL